VAVALDDGVGRVLRALEEQGIRENTLVFFLSDDWGRLDVAENRPLRGHKGRLYGHYFHSRFE
jgi:arylsulfatase A-like enzyme